MSVCGTDTGRTKAGYFSHTWNGGNTHGKHISIKVASGLLTFLCAAERVSLLVLWVFATASSSVPPRSPPGAGRARSVCRWWSGCTDSWRALSGRPRRTKPRDWCSSGRWDAGPSDNLWSEKGETRRAEPGMRRVRMMARRIRRFGYRPVFCLQIKGSIQRAFSLSLARSRCLLSLALRESEKSPVRLLPGRYHENIPTVNYIRLAFLCDLFLCCPFRRANKSLPRCYIDGQMPSRNASVSAKNAMDAYLRRRLPLKQKLGALIKKRT